ncbi:MAG TPA: carboxypeptidase-like regulatory domain-containing protein [Lentimicrobium sp.]|nr:carboxypeptidase-like regulatory domain-containing protein [Lentimicrobium sp.]
MNKKHHKKLNNNLFKNILVISLLIVSLQVLAESGPSKASITSAEASSTTSRLTGKVIDQKTGEALAGVLITVEGTELKTYSDLDGNFNISSLHPGTYSLVLSLISYKNSLIENLTINAGDKEDIEVKLNNQ